MKKKINNPVNRKKLNRNESYYRDEEFEENNKDNCAPYDYKDAAVYKKYNLDPKKVISLLNKVLKIIERGKHLSIMSRQDIVNVVAELFKEDGYNVYLPKKPQNGGISLLAERSVHFMGFAKYILMIRKIFSERKIGIEEIRKLEYRIQETNASKGVIITTGRLTKGALKFIKERPGKIFYLDGKKLEQKLRFFEIIKKKNINKSHATV